jgi:hypothetical protein
MYRAVRCVILAVLVIGVVSLAIVGHPVSAQGEETTAHVWFREDFSTRANRWRLFDVGKAVVSYDQSALKLRADPANYALWSVPDTDLKLERYDIEVVAKLVAGDNDARVGVIVSYRNDNDMLVVAVSRQGNVYLGRYYFGIWSDLIPPTRIKLNADQSITLRAAIDNDHALRIFVNDQAAGKTTIKNFRASSFGLFALSGKKGGVHVAFSRFTVSDLR